MGDELQPGDHVEWNAHGGRSTRRGTAEGVVEKKFTHDTEHDGRMYRASEQDPRYLVRSEKSGRTAVHKGSALRKKGPR